MPDDVALDITAATLADVDAVHRIEEASFPAPWRREFFAAEVMGESRFNIVARRGEILIGYLFSMWIFDEMHVNKIAVEGGYRRQGIADALMQRCFDFAREHEISSISLEVRQSNRAAQEFYRHLDFETSYIRKRYYPDGEAAVVMVRAT
ncbi:MAG TPA: ribosomal protein S18-alanine N-acetyltransferase [Thermoanaerobaculia bacterium]|jgi:ribosomal-protein-alanine N-acetyltransferase|nr:ribosomal protein S18-alanine N-acetyltransferase [Thermoanaerobaculia bacterium]